MADITFEGPAGLQRFRDMGDGTFAPVYAVGGALTDAGPADVVTASIAAASAGQPAVVLANGSPVPVPGQFMYLGAVGAVAAETVLVQSVSGVTVTTTANLAGAHTGGTAQWAAAWALKGHLDNQTIYASAVRTATSSSADQSNYRRRGLHLVIDVTAVTSSTVTPAIQGKDPVSGKYYTLLTGAAISGTSTVALKVYPGITPVTNVAVSDVLPRTWRVTMTHGDASNWTYSVGAVLLA